MNRLWYALTALASVLLVILAMWIVYVTDSGIPGPPTAQVATSEEVEQTPTEVPDTTTEPTMAETEQPGEATPTPEPQATVTPTPNVLPLEGAVIGIDAGHQAVGNTEQEAVAPGSSETKDKNTSGTQGVNTRTPEYALNLEIALLLRDALWELGAEVVMVRDSNDVDISNQERAIMMNEADVDLCIRIHANGSDDPDEKGAMMLVPSGEYATDIQAESLRAGELIFAAFLEYTGAESFGVIGRDDLTGFNWSEVPVCLIEMGYMTNAEEDALLDDWTYQDLIVEGLAEGIRRWYTTL